MRKSIQKPPALFSHIGRNVIQCNQSGISLPIYHSGVSVNCSYGKTLCGELRRDTENYWRPQLLGGVLNFFSVIFIYWLSYKYNLLLLFNSSTSNTQETTWPLLPVRTYHQRFSCLSSTLSSSSPIDDHKPTAIYITRTQQQTATPLIHHNQQLIRTTTTINTPKYFTIFLATLDNAYISGH